MLARFRNTRLRTPITSVIYVLDKTWNFFTTVKTKSNKPGTAQVCAPLKAHKKQVFQISRDTSVRILSNFQCWKIPERDTMRLRNASSQQQASTSRDRPKTAPYLKPKIAKALQSVKVFSSTKKNKSWTELALQGERFEIFLTFCRKSSKN